MIGLSPRARVYQTNWFQFSVGAYFIIQPPSSVTFALPLGTRTVTVDNINIPDNQLVVENDFGSRKVSTGLQVAIGPRLGAEFYLKWIPHLALGFSTGILTTFGGNTKTTDSSRDRTYTVTGGVPQSATNDITTTTEKEAMPGLRGVTFGIGGTQFSITQAFTLRCVW